MKILWGRAAGRCAVPTCRVELFAEATEYDPAVVIGEIAHIEAASDSGPRANPGLAMRERDEYDNLILLCQNCHARLDGQKNTNTVEVIKDLRNRHEEWVRNSLPERGRTTTGWATILLQGAHPFDLEPAITALLPDFPAGDPVVIRADPDREEWDAIHTHLFEEVGALLSAGDPFDFRLAVFPLAPVSACLALGYHITNRPRLRLFQYHRDEHSWSWPRAAVGYDGPRVSGLPEAAVGEAGDIAFCFHLSAAITDDATAEVGHPFIGKVDVAVDAPSTNWLQEEEQLISLGRVAREVFEAGAHKYPNSHTWHIFYAGPALGGVIVGQQINPTMCPPVQLYEFRRARRPAYQPSILLGG